MERTIEPPDPVADDVVGDAVDSPERRRVPDAAAGAGTEGDRKPVSRQDGPDVSASGASRGPATGKSEGRGEPEAPEESAAEAEQRQPEQGQAEREGAGRGEAAEGGASVDAGKSDSSEHADPTSPGSVSPDAGRASAAGTGAGSGSAEGGDPDEAADPDGASGAEPEESGEKSAGAGAGRGRRRIAVLVSVAAFAYALDLISKIIVVTRLEHEPPIDVIGNLLRFHAVRNPGAAFGIGEALTVVFTVIAAAVIVVIARIARKLRSTPWAVALGMLLGGAFGNLTDRIFRSPGIFEGHVVDFIAPAHFAVFNLADSAIVCGGILIVILSFRGIDPDGTVHRD